MRQALLTCDRCGHTEAVPVGKNAEGWRMLMKGQQGTPEAMTVGSDLCPDCDKLLMDGFLSQNTS